MVGIRWKDWNTIPVVSPRNRASASSLSAPSSVSATVTVPLSTRSRPAMIISRVDLPEPEGPSTASEVPCAIRSEMPRSTCTSARPLPSVRWTLSMSMTEFWEAGESGMNVTIT